MTERSYVLGTDASEVERLSLQHQVWRPRMLSAFKRAGLKAGQVVLDVGAGPGFASIDLAEIVGPTGRVVSLERSTRFCEAACAAARRFGLDQLEVRETDVVKEGFGDAVADAAWCRWVLCFASDPGAVVSHIASALKPGGLAIFHEYGAYETWKLAPPRDELTRFVQETMARWRAAGGEPNIALKLPHLLRSQGLEILWLEPIVHCIPADHVIAQWPLGYWRHDVSRRREAGAAAAEDVLKLIDRLSTSATDWLITPMVLEIAARRIRDVA
jgi:SAM-dependent methyltransferase